MDGTQGDDGMTDGRFMVECLQHPSIPKSGDKETREADDSSTAEEIKAAALLLAAQVMQRGGDGERRDEFVGGRGRKGQGRRALISSQIAVTLAPRAGAFDTFGPPFVTLDATHCLRVSGHMSKGIS